MTLTHRSGCSTVKLVDSVVIKLDVNDELLSPDAVVPVANDC